MYTCGFAKVIIAASVKVEKRFLFSFASTFIALSFLNEAFNLRIPYPDSQIAENKKSQSEICVVRLLTKYETPLIPIII